MNISAQIRRGLLTLQLMLLSDPLETDEGKLLIRPSFCSLSRLTV